MLHHGPAGQVGHKEEIAIAVVQFHFGGGEVIWVQAEVGVHEALQVPFAFYQASHGGGVMIGFENASLI